MRHGGLVFHDVSHSRLGGNEQTCNRSGILQRRADHLGRIDHASRDEVFVNLGLGVEAKILIIAVDQLARNDCTIMAGILSDLTQRRLKGLANDVDTAGLVIIGAGQGVECLGRIKQRGATARNNAFFDRSAGRV